MRLIVSAHTFGFFIYMKIKEVDVSFCTIFLILLKAQLEPKEIKIMVWRYYCNLKLREIGELDGKKCSRQRIRQIIKKCLIKIKKKKFLTNDYL